MVSVPRTYQTSIDWSRSRTGFQGYPQNFVSYGTVGHTDSTPAYVRVEEGDVLIEVTLTPSGDEVVARLDTSAMSQGALYLPLSYGQRVVLLYPNGKNGDPLLIGRCSDASWPFPEEVAGVATAAEQRAPMFAFLKTGDGQLLAIETGAGGDVLIHSGASAQMKVSPGEQILMTGRTHLGSSADFGSAPTGSKVAENGFVEDGEEAGNYNPLPNTRGRPADGTTLVPPTPIVIPPPLTDTNARPYPQDGIVRFKDQLGSNVFVDPDFWAWLVAAATALAALPVPVTVPLPAQLFVAPYSSSLNTASDD